MDISDWVIDLDTVQASTSSTYPAEFQDRVKGRVKRRLGEKAGLTQIAVLVADLPPGVSSSLRLWQSREDELIFVLEGTPTLVTDEGEVVLRPGQSVGFPAGQPIGHHIINRSAAMARILEVGAIAPEGNVSHYTQDDLMLVPGADGKRGAFVHRDGAPYDQ